MTAAADRAAGRLGLGLGSRAGAPVFSGRLLPPWVLVSMRGGTGTGAIRERFAYIRPEEPITLWPCRDDLLAGPHAPRRRKYAIDPETARARSVKGGLASQRPEVHIRQLVKAEAELTGEHAAALRDLLARLDARPAA